MLRKLDANASKVPGAAVSEEGRTALTTRGWLTGFEVMCCLNCWMELRGALSISTIRSPELSSCSRLEGVLGATVVTVTPPPAFSSTPRPMGGWEGSM